MAMADVLPSDRVRSVEIQGVVDTGSQYLALPESVVSQLDLPPLENVRVRYADQRSAVRSQVGQVQLTLLGLPGLFRAMVEPHRTTALIGAIVLEDLDLLVDCTRQIVYPRDVDGIVAEVD